MKKMTALLLAALFALALVGCGGSNAESAATETPAATDAPAATEAPTETAETAETEAAPAETKEEDLKAIALSLVDHPVQDLYDAIGEPTGEAEYASSCLVSGGQDGTLPYDGFTVYTLVRPDGTETVYDVE